MLNYRFSAHNVLGIRQFADSLSCTQLVTAAEKYIDRYFAKVSQSEEFLSLSEYWTMFELSVSKHKFPKQNIVLCRRL